MDLKRKAHLYLFSITVIWGLSFPFLKWSTDYMSITSLLVWRFLLAALVCTVFVPREIFKSFSVKKERVLLIKASLLMGGTMFGAFWLQMCGIQHTSASHSAFITGFYCVFTPLLSSFIGRERLGLKLMVAIVISFLGLYFLSIDSEFTLNWGDFLTLLCAVCVSIHIILTDKFSRVCSINVLNALQLWVMFLLSAAALAISGFPPMMISFAQPPLLIFALIFYLGVLCTALTFWIQTKQQKYTSPTYVALILLMEPVFGAFFATLILHESFSSREILGAVLILAGLLLSQIKIRMNPFYQS